MRSVDYLRIPKHIPAWLPLLPCPRFVCTGTPPLSPGQLRLPSHAASAQSTSSRCTPTKPKEVAQNGGSPLYVRHQVPSARSSKQSILLPVLIASFVFLGLLAVLSAVLVWHNKSLQRRVHRLVRKVRPVQLAGRRPLLYMLHFSAPGVSHAYSVV